jgi:hypothetical protein
VYIYVNVYDYVQASGHGRGHGHGHWTRIWIWIWTWTRTCTLGMYTKPGEDIMDNGQGHGEHRPRTWWTPAMDMDAGRGHVQRNSNAQNIASKKNQDSGFIMRRGILCAGLQGAKETPHHYSWHGLNLCAEFHSLTLHKYSNVSNNMWKIQIIFILKSGSFVEWFHKKKPDVNLTLPFL